MEKMTLDEIVEVEKTVQDCLTEALEAIVLDDEEILETIEEKKEEVPLPISYTSEDTPDEHGLVYVTRTITIDPDTYVSANYRPKNIPKYKASNEDTTQNKTEETEEKTESIEPSEEEEAISVKEADILLEKEKETADEAVVLDYATFIDGSSFLCFDENSGIDYTQIAMDAGPKKPVTRDNCQTTFAQCRAKNPLFCRYHGPKILEADIAQALRLMGVRGKVSVTKDKEAKNPMTFRVTVGCRPDQKDDVITILDRNFFSKNPGISSSDTLQQKSAKEWTKEFEMDILRADMPPQKNDLKGQRSVFTTKKAAQAGKTMPVVGTTPEGKTPRKPKAENIEIPTEESSTETGKDSTPATEKVSPYVTNSLGEPYIYGYPTDVKPHDWVRLDRYNGVSDSTSPVTLTIKNPLNLMENYNGETPQDLLFEPEVVNHKVDAFCDLMEKSGLEVDRERIRENMLSSEFPYTTDLIREVGDKKFKEALVKLGYDGFLTDGEGSIAVFNEEDIKPVNIPTKEKAKTVKETEQSPKSFSTLKPRKVAPYSYEAYGEPPNDDPNTNKTEIGGTGDIVGSALLQYVKEKGHLLKLPKKWGDYSSALARWQKANRSGGLYHGKPATILNKPKMNDFGIVDPLADYIDNILDGGTRQKDRGLFTALFGRSPKPGSNDESFDDAPPEVQALAQSKGAEAVVDAFLEAREKFADWVNRAKAAKKNKMNSSEENTASQTEDYISFDDLEARENADTEYNNAYAEVDRYENGTPTIEMFSQEQMKFLRNGDVLRFDHSDANWVVKEYDKDNDTLTVVPSELEDNPLFEEWEKENSEKVFRISKDGIEEIIKEREEINEPEDERGTDETGAGNAQSTAEPSTGEENSADATERAKDSPSKELKQDKPSSVVPMSEETKDKIKKIYEEWVDEPIPDWVNELDKDEADKYANLLESARNASSYDEDDELPDDVDDSAFDRLIEYEEAKAKEFEATKKERDEKKKEEDRKSATQNQKVTLSDADRKAKLKSFKRGQKLLFINDEGEKKEVTFLQDNRDGTADIQIKTPGRNRYEAVKVEVKTASADALFDNGIHQFGGTKNKTTSWVGDDDLKDVAQSISVNQGFPIEDIKRDLKSRFEGKKPFTEGIIRLMEKQMTPDDPVLLEAKRILAESGKQKAVQ